MRCGKIMMTFIEYIYLNNLRKNDHIKIIGENLIGVIKEKTCNFCSGHANFEIMSMKLQKN